MKLFDKFNHVMATEGYDYVVRNLNKPRPKRSVYKTMLMVNIIGGGSRKPNKSIKKFIDEQIY